MRIGTWNLAGRWTEEHRDFLLAMDCDVLLLTEVNDAAELPEYAIHQGTDPMAVNRHWTAVASRSPVEPLPDPHAACAAAEIDGVLFCSSVLPWRGCGRGPVWGDGSLAERTARAVAELMANLPDQPLVWGGDWNHSMSGREYAGSLGGRRAIQAALGERGLIVPTAGLPHHLEGVRSIDHVAVPASWTVTSADRVTALDSTEQRLSDHDAYIVDVTR